MWVLALIIGLPLLEIALFVVVGGWLGLWPTLAIVLSTGVLGVMILQRRGLAARGLARKVATPLALAADGGLIMAAAILLILPGFFTDTLGLLLLLPPVRALVLAQLAQRVSASTVVFQRGFDNRGFTREDVIDGDFTEVPPNADRLRGPSKWTED